MNMQKVKPLKLMLRSEAGQTAVEYILLLVVIVSIMMPIFQTLKEKFLNDDGTCSDPSKKSFICFFKKAGFDSATGFRFYSMQGAANLGN